VGVTWISIFFGLVSAVGVVVLGLFFKTEKATVPNPQKTKLLKRISGYTLLRKHALIMSSGFVIALIIQGIFASTLSTLIVHHYGKSVDILTIVIASSALSGILQALRWIWEPFLARKIGIWSDRDKGRIPYLKRALLLGVISFPLLALSAHPVIWIIITIITLLSSTALTTLVDALASDCSQSEGRIRFFTYYTIVQDLGAALGPIVGYFLISLTLGFEILYSSCAVLFFVLGVMWMRKEKLQIV